MRAVKILLGVIFVITTFLGVAYAMKHMPRHIEDAVKVADIVFLGRVEKRDVLEDKTSGGICWQASAEKPNCGPKNAQMSIQKIWKGDVGDVVTVYSEDACYCLGYYLELGRQVVVFATKNTDGQCGTAEYCTMIDRFPVEEVEKYFSGKASE